MPPQTWAQQEVQPPVPVVDAHVHLIGGRAPPRDFDGGAKAALEAMDRFGIAQAIILPPPQIDAQHIYDHDEIAKAIGGRRDRFAFLGGGGSLNPMLHRFGGESAVSVEVQRAFRTIAQKIIDAGAAGFGEIASLHISARRGHPYEFAPADHPLLKLLADIAADHGMPIDLHMDAVAGRASPPERFAEGHNPPVLPDTLAAFERLLSHNTRAKIVWAHGGSDPLGAMTPMAIDRLMQEHGNLFVSLRIVGSGAPMHNKLLAPGGLDPAWRSLLLRHPDRFVIGTDSFFAATGRVGTGPGFAFAQRNIPKLMAMRHALTLLPPGIATKIARDNALRIYRFRAP
jgi:hypothetical protein